MTTQRIARKKLVGFQTDLVVSSGDAAYDTSAECAAIIQANTSVQSFSLFWELTVPAQQILAWGYGTPSAQRNQGYMWMYAADLSTGFEEGNLRLVISNARSTRVQVVKELNTQRLHTTNPATDITATPTDINTMIAMPPRNAVDVLIYRLTVMASWRSSANGSRGENWPEGGLISASISPPAQSNGAVAMSTAPDKSGIVGIDLTALDSITRPMTPISKTAPGLSAAFRAAALATGPPFFPAAIATGATI